MLPKIHRLTKKNDFTAVFKGGRSVQGDFLTYKVIKNHLPVSRFGFVVSKRVSNKAVIRNKVKRRLRNIIQKQLQNIKGSFDIIIISLPGAEKRTFKELEEGVINFLKRYT